MVGQKAKPVFSTVYTTVSSAVDASVFDVTALFLFMSLLISRIQSGKCTRNSKGWPYHLIFGPFVRFCVVCWHCVCLLPLFTYLAIVYALSLYCTCSPHYHTLPHQCTLKQTHHFIEDTCSRIWSRITEKYVFSSFRNVQPTSHLSPSPTI